MRTSTTLVPLLALSLGLLACGGDGPGATEDADALADVAKGDGSDDVDVSADTVEASDSALGDTAVAADTAVTDTATTGGCPTPPYAPAGATLAGDGRFRTLSGLDVAGLPPRDITIYLPADYDSAPARRYPVVYMHDGQNLFFDETSFAGEWGVDETVDALVAAGTMEPVIVVGVDNTHERMADYTPTVDATYGGGNGAAYVAWLADVVKPAADAFLRTRCERDATGIMGSSLGGLISLYAALERPEVFGRIGVVSPSLWWDDEVMIAQFSAYDGALPARLWLDMGTAEGGDADGDVTMAVAELRAARESARAKGMVVGEDLGYYEVKNAPHNEGAWRQRLPYIFRYLYGTEPIGGATALDLAFFAGELSLSGRAHTSALVTARYGTEARLTIPNDLVTFSVDGDALSVDADGGVDALASGEATITATYDGQSATRTLAVGGDGLSWVTFDVAVPFETPGTVYIVGDLGALGAWDPGAVPMEFVEATTHWQVSLQLPSGATFAYKYTRGSWGTVEATAGGADVPNRSGGPATAGVVSDTVERWIDL
ncbi:MAG: hypothetical protein EP329_21030 [Deltaproteobacteria bacterium]|nr:MAG: hypothetical protein EP329_21030 [Deltaproteobacteria bacterium]